MSTILKQEVDDALLRGVERTFGKITIDLAATDDDHKAPKWITPERDTFTVNWAEEIGDGLGWLNPPPEQDLMRWSEKCALEGKRGARFVVVVPAIVDTFWFWEYLIPNAANYVLYPRKFYQGEPMPLISKRIQCRPTSTRRAATLVELDDGSYSIGSARWTFSTDTLIADITFLSRLTGVKPYEEAVFGGLFNISTFTRPDVAITTTVGGFSGTRR